MQRLSTFALATLLSITSFAQTADIVIFSEDGTPFTLIVDGEVKNADPQTRVVATGIRTETPVTIVKFADAAIPQMRKPLFLEMGKEHTYMLTMNKKGERVLRATGQAALGTAAAQEPSKPKPSSFQPDEAKTPTQVIDGSSEQVITTTTIVEENGGVEGENVNINMGVNGVGFNVNVKVDDGMGAGSTTTRTTTTTTQTTAKPIIDTKPVEAAPAVYSMPGYSGRVGCNWPMTGAEFAEVKKSIESKTFEDTKMTMAKQVGSGRCFTADQVKGMMGLFTFEDNKLDFAKYAYERTFDIDNYFKVNDAFTFEGSVDELNDYIQAR